MKTAGLLLLLALVPTPAQADSGVAHWPAGPVQVVDEIAMTVRPGNGRVQFWRMTRDRVLSDYAAAGFQFVVSERHSTSCNYTPGVILLCRGGMWGWPTSTQTGTFPDDHIPYGVASLTDPRARNNRWPNTRTVLCHELGHALGLGHSSEGCMHATTATMWPSPTDLAALSAAREHQE